MLHSVIMAGGVGSRFWPQSRRSLPKQFLRMTGDSTLIQQTARRCQPLIPNERIWIVTGAAHAVETARQLPEIPAGQILIEPCGRNTAPCIGLAAIQLLAIDPEAVMLVMPADHVIQPIDQFQRAVDDAMMLIAEHPSMMVLFGIEPTFPATGFGYLQRGDPIGNDECRAYRIKSFQEKPDLLSASRFMATGNYDWNCGIFVWHAQTILDALEEFAPDVFTPLQRLREGIGRDAWQDLLELQFPQMPSISIDYAVLEKAAGRVCVIRAPFEWDDVGSWHALPRLLETDRDGNTLDGLCCTIDTEGCIIRSSDSHLIAAIGVKDLIIVHTPTATLVVDKRDEEAVKTLISEMERRELVEFL